VDDDDQPPSSPVTVKNEKFSTSNGSSSMALIDGANTDGFLNVSMIDSTTVGGTIITARFKSNNQPVFIIDLQKPS
jgi:hypothetical protein